MTDSNKPKYPECEKLAAVAERSQKCGELIEWLQGEKGFTFARMVEGDDDALNSLGRLAPVHTTTESLLAEFFGVDMGKVEKEREEMIATLGA